MKREKGITLIALVITIIVLLILAGVSIATLTGENGILTKANDAKSQTEVGHLKEMVQTDILGYQTENNSEKVTSKQLRDVLDKYFKNVPEKAEDLEKNLEDPDYSLEAKAEYGKDVKLKVSDLYKGIVTENPSSSDGPTIKVGEKTVILNKDNIKDYLGKVVTNFKDDYEDKEEVVHIGDTDYTVSKKYRLYYVDFDDPKGNGTGKYGDGVGTIYLKAECTDNNGHLQLEEKYTANDENIKIKQLNPSLYETGVTAPTTPNMQAVTWLLNEDNWAGLKKGVKISEEDINYIVGTPSLEMMMDSYNTKYADVLKGKDKPDSTNIPEGERRKLFYKYSTGDNGYKVGSCVDSSDGYGTYTPANSIYPDSRIDTMYYPGKIDNDVGNCYWLASPLADGIDRVCLVSFYSGGYVTYRSYSSNTAFCPLVSLKSTAKIELEN